MPHAGPETPLRLAGGLPLPWSRIQAERIPSALTRREWTLNGGARRGLSHAVLVEAGRGHIAAGNDIHGFAAPVLIWMPPRSIERLRLEAGAVGHLVGIADDVLASAIANGPESAALHDIVSKRFTGSLAGSDVLRSEIAHCVAAIVREVAAPTAGSWTSLSAHVLLLVVGLWRASGVETVAVHARGTASAVLQRFHYLIELHFRERWPIPRYADAIAVSKDRLHALCTRELGRPPLGLVHERIVREAKLLLERSMLTTEQISAHLGFKDPAHFNRFFKANAGAAPGAYRRAIKPDPRLSLPHGAGSYADWP